MWRGLRIIGLVVVVVGKNWAGGGWKGEVGLTVGWLAGENEVG